MFLLTLLEKNLMHKLKVILFYIVLFNGLSLFSEEENKPVLWDCKTEQVNELKFKDFKNITVGEPFQLQCNGPAMDWNQEEVELLIDYSLVDKNKIKILKKNNITATSASWTAVSYLVDKKPLEGLSITDSRNNSVNIRNFNVVIQSVIDPKSQPKPFGAIGPMAIPFSKQSKIILALIILFGLLVVFFYFFKKMARKAFLRTLKLNSKVLKPDSEFYKNLRHLKKSYMFQSLSADQEIDSKFVSDLEVYFKDYLQSFYKVKVVKRKLTKIPKAIKKHNPNVPVSVMKRLTLALREMSGLKTANNKVKVSDAQQLIQFCQKSIVSDKMIGSHS